MVGELDARSGCCCSMLSVYLEGDVLAVGDEAVDTVVDGAKITLRIPVGFHPLLSGRRDAYFQCSALAAWPGDDS